MKKLFGKKEKKEKGEKKDKKTDLPEQKSTSPQSSPPASPQTEQKKGADSKKETNADRYVNEKPSSTSSPAPNLYANDTEDITVQPTNNVTSSVSFFMEGEMSEKKQSTSSLRNWNEEFQELIEIPDSKEKFLRLKSLAHDFVHTAEQYARVIIEEYYLPADQKTLKPMTQELGGIAGGEKYKWCSILFKFAVDYRGIYGGDENAMKASAHDLKALQHYFQSNVRGLHFPLEAIIDYHGFRLQAVSLLPIGSGSLKYGSEDGGMTVHMADSELNLKIQAAGKLLNLKGHKVGDPSAPQEIFSCCDLEGHKGKDNRYYLLDFARTAPPEPPTKKGSHLYNLFRMEFVLNYFQPLSSDGFSNFGSIDSNVHNKEIQEAHSYLLGDVIPKFARSLDTINLNTFKSDLHKNGINYRYLGKIRSFVKKPQVRDSLLIEGLARVCKSHLKEIQRQVGRQGGVISDEKYKTVIINFLNLILGKSPRSDEFWNSFVNKDLENKFESILTEEEKNGTVVRELAMNNVSLLIDRIRSMTGLRFSDRSMDDLNKLGKNFEFVAVDLLELQTVVRHLNIISYADGMLLYFEALERPPTDANAISRLLSLSKERLDDSLQQLSENYLTTIQLANVILMKAKYAPDLLGERKKALALYTQVYNQERIENGLRALGAVKMAKVIYLNGKTMNDELVKSIEHCKKALELDPNLYEAYIRWGLSLARQARLNLENPALTKEADEQLKKALALEKKMNGSIKDPLTIYTVVNALALLAFINFEGGKKDHSLVAIGWDQLKRANDLLEEGIKGKVVKIEVAYSKLKRMVTRLDLKGRIFSGLWKMAIICSSVSCLQGLFRENTQDLENLDLSSEFPNFQPFLIDPLFFALHNANALTSLNLWGISDVDDEVIAKIFKSPVKLKSLRVAKSSIKHLTPIFKNCPSLEYLDISETSQLTEQALADEISGAPPSFVNLKCNKLPIVTDKFLARLASGVKQIQSLSLSDSKITEEGLQSLKVLENLTSLILSGCSVSGESLKEFKKLNKVDFYSTQGISLSLLKDLSSTVSIIRNPSGSIRFFPGPSTYSIQSQRSGVGDRLCLFSNSVLFMDISLTTNNCEFHHFPEGQVFGFSGEKTKVYSISKKTPGQPRYNVMGDGLNLDVLLPNPTVPTISVMLTLDGEDYSVNGNFQAGKNFFANVSISGNYVFKVSSHDNSPGTLEVLARTNLSHAFLIYSVLALAYMKRWY